MDIRSLVGLLVVGLLIVLVYRAATTGRRHEGGIPRRVYLVLLPSAVILGIVFLPAFNIAPGALADLAFGPVMLVAAILPTLGSIDAALHPDSAWRAADQSKLVWVGLQIGLWFMFGAGAIASLVYFLAIRPKLVAPAQREGLKTTGGGSTETH